MLYVYKTYADVWWYHLNISYFKEKKKDAKPFRIGSGDNTT